MAKKQWGPLPALPQEKVPAQPVQALPAPVEPAQAGTANAGAVRTAVHRPQQRGPLGGLGSVMGGLGSAMGGLGSAMGNLGPLPLVLAVAAMNRGGGGGLTGMMTTQSQGRVPMQPMAMKGLLGDLAGYLPGNSSVSAAKASKVLGMVDELRNMGGPSTVALTPANPMERNMGLLGALGRNLPFNGANNLTMISQMMGMANSFHGGFRTQSNNGGGPLGALSNLGNVANMVNTMRAVGSMGTMSAPPPPQPQPQAPVLQGTVMPNQNDIKNTVNRLLSGMDDRQKSELMAKARQFLSQ